MSNNLSSTFKEMAEEHQRQKLERFNVDSKVIDELEKALATRPLEKVERRSGTLGSALKGKP